MIKKVYLHFRAITIGLSIITFALLYLLTNESLVPYLAQKYLKEFGVEYSKVKGTLLSGATIHDVKYRDFIRAKKLHVDYNLPILFMDFPRFSKVETNGVYIDINKIPSSDKNDTKIEIPLFSISKLLNFRT